MISLLKEITLDYNRLDQYDENGLMEPYYYERTIVKFYDDGSVVLLEQASDDDECTWVVINSFMLEIDQLLALIREMKDIDYEALPEV